MITDIEQSWLDKVETLDTELEDGTKPQWWINYGFDFDTALKWRETGAFEPERTRELIDAGFNTDELLKKINPPDDGSGFIVNNCSIAYAYCNYDLDIQDVHRLARE